MYDALVSEILCTHFVSLAVQWDEEDAVSSTDRVEGSRGDMGVLSTHSSTDGDVGLSIATLTAESGQVEIT